MLVTDTQGAYGYQGYDVQFEPGCRNDWHTHAGGQLLLCTGGQGYYQEKGNPACVPQKGDVVEILPHIVHWHGAVPNSPFTNIGISPDTQKGGVTWCLPVTEEEYHEATGG